MLEVTMRVNTDNIIGVKETLAEYCEKYGDVVFVDVKEVQQSEQMRIEKNA